MGKEDIYTLVYIDDAGTLEWDILSKDKLVPRIEGLDFTIIDFERYRVKIFVNGESIAYGSILEYVEPQKKSGWHLK